MNAVIELNKIIKRDVNLLFFVNVFSEKFIEMHYAFFVDMFSEYDQILLNFCSCNLTAIQTPIGLLRRTWLPQKVMNSVIQFVWIILWVLETQTSHICKQFLNDIKMKGSKTNYNRMKALSNVWGFILKHIQNLDKILCDLKKVELTVVEVKSQWCMLEIDVISFMCNLKGCYSDSVKILKIVEWLSYVSIVEIKVFIEVCVYY